MSGKKLASLEIGKWYVRRDGQISGPVTKSDSDSFPFIASCHTYDPFGRWDAGDIPSPFDLISEYQPLGEKSLQQLCDEVNAGLCTLDKVKDQLETQEYYGPKGFDGGTRKWEALTANHLVQFRPRPAPAFDSFKLPDAGYLVRLDGPVLHIGCLPFQATQAFEDLYALARGMQNKGCYHDVLATRDGVRYGSNENITWADVDSILAALEKAGVK